MSLIELVNNATTDKNTCHSYLELYENLLCSKKQTASHVLEVGIGDLFPKNGGSIKLWHDYFPHATVYALDIQTIHSVMDEIQNKERIILYTETDAYDEVVVENLFTNKGIKFDVVLDDGPHTLVSMIKFIQLYAPLLKDDGILIIEDIPQTEWTKILSLVVPKHLRSYIEIYDRRNVKGRFDDIVFVINRNKTITP